MPTQHHSFHDLWGFSRKDLQVAKDWAVPAGSYDLSHQSSNLQLLESVLCGLGVLCEKLSGKSNPLLPIFEVHWGIGHEGSILNEVVVHRFRLLAGGRR